MIDARKDIYAGKDADVEAAWATEIERRINEVEFGKAETVSWHEARTRIRRRLRELDVTPT